MGELNILEDRKPLSKKIRFEVFKRDKFKCQYCGAGAPDVILEVDHISPVAKGGKNDIMNLVTACFDCNRGKKDKLLSDDSAVSKQRTQIEELQEKREQLKLLVKWRNGLKGLDDDKVKVIVDEIESYYEGKYTVNQAGKKDISKWLKKYSLSIILDCIQLASKYLKRTNLGFIEFESTELFFSKIPRIAWMKDLEVKDPLLAKGYYLKNLCKNKFRIQYYQMNDFEKLIKVCLFYGCPYEIIMETFNESERYDLFFEQVETLISLYGEEDNG